MWSVAVKSWKFNLGIFIFCPLLPRNYTITGRCTWDIPRILAWRIKWAVHSEREIFISPFEEIMKWITKSVDDGQQFTRCDDQWTWWGKWAAAALGEKTNYLKKKIFHICSSFFSAHKARRWRGGKKFLLSRFSFFFFFLGKISWPVLAAVPPPTASLVLASVPRRRKTVKRTQT